MIISIIIPVYNEEKYLRKFINQIVRELNGSKLNYEIIISENGSRDKTLTLARQLTQKNDRIVVTSSPVANYGLAVKRGFLKSRGKYLVLFDLDYFDIPFISCSLPLLKTNSAVIGAKHVEGSNDTRSIKRRLITLIFSTLLKILFGLKLSDTHGIKILNRRHFLPLIKKSRLTREIFDTELLIRAEYENLPVAEIPVEVIEKRASRTSIMKRAIKTLGDLYRLKLIMMSEYD